MFLPKEELQRIAPKRLVDALWPYLLPVLVTFDDGGTVTNSLSIIAYLALPSCA